MAGRRAVAWGGVQCMSEFQECHIGGRKNERLLINREIHQICKYITNRFITELRHNMKRCKSRKLK